MKHSVVFTDSVVIETKPTRTITVTMPRGGDVEARLRQMLGRDELNGWRRDVEVLSIQETTPWWAVLIRRWYDYQEFRVTYNIAFGITMKNYRRLFDLRWR